MHSPLLTALVRSLGIGRLAVLGGAHRLSAGEWAQLARALPVVLSMRLALLSTTSTRVHAGIVRLPSGNGGLSPAQVAGLSRAVSRAARLVPSGTCLTQAFALQHLLRRHGEGSRVEIGFLRSDGEGVSGHAWLVHDERVVIGGRSAAEFTLTLTLEG